MIVGDSISQGLEGDHTWRYRLRQHLSSTGANVNFVGPYTGTTQLPIALPAGWPDVAVPPVFDGAYRGGLSFDSDHFAQWGRQAHQAKDDIQTRVRQYRPDYLLVELGFNDLGWGVSNAAGLTADIKALIANARAAKPDIKILVANVVHRTPLPNLPGLDALINSYNSGLAAALQSVNTSASPVRLVDISSAYSPTADTYDGLHPNGLGDYKIARAFAGVLSGQFGLGGAFGAIPSSVPKLIPERPSMIFATPTDAGITVSWSHSFGASGYWFWMRDVTNGESFQRLPLPIPADSWKLTWVQVGHTYEFKVVPSRGNDNGPESAVASVVANPKTAAGPGSPYVTPGNGYITVGWLFDGSDKFEFCLVSVNGSLESPLSNCLRSSP
jgi:lysophospholipase L1-like esterase